MDGAGLAIALAATACGLAAVGAAGVALTQLLDARELFGRVGGREEAVLDASALPVRSARYGGVGDAIAAGDGAADAIEGRDTQGGSFLFLRSSIAAVVSIRVFEQVVQ